MNSSLQIFSHRELLSNSIANEINTFFSQLEYKFDLDDFLHNFVANRVNLGKQMRGCLAMELGLAMGVDRAVLLDAAMSLEIYGYGILMQDDVTDKAQLRRGYSTLHFDLRSHLSKKYRDVAHVADHVAIYVADSLFFLAGEVMLRFLQKTSLEKATRAQFLTMRELQQLALGQIEDVRLSAFKDENQVSLQTIENMIRAKSACYSLRWPAKMAVSLSDATYETVSKVGQIAEDIGVLFQIRDDELGIFGDSEKTGKSSISDIIEGKKTFYWALLKERTSSEDKCWQAFGNELASDEQIELFKKTVEESGVRIEVSQMVEKRMVTIEKQIAKLAIPEQAQDVLKQVMFFVVQREK